MIFFLFFWKPFDKNGLQIWKSRHDVDSTQHQKKPKIGSTTVAEEEQEKQKIENTNIQKSLPFPMNVMTIKKTCSKTVITQQKYT